MLFDLSPDMLLPSDLPGLSERITEANRAATDAVAKVERAGRKAGQLAEEAKAAPRFDQLARQAAIAAGEKPPKSTEQAKRAAAEEARKDAEALEVVAKQRVRELFDTVEDEYEDYLESRRELAEEAAEPLRAMIPEMVDRVVAFNAANVIYQRARAWYNNPASAALTAHAGNLPRQYERALERQRDTHPGTPVPDDLPDLLAALSRKLGEEMEGRAR